jgi:hypothetical protein
VIVLAAAQQASSAGPSWWLPLVGLAGVLGAAVIGGLFVWAQARRDRRRSLYSDAYKAAMSWVEMVYRVRRRCEGQEQELVARFHDAQEDISYHEGWLSSESPALCRSYCRLVAAVREAAAPLIQAAWKEPVRPLAEHTRPEDVHPDVTAARDALLLDAREHLSPWFWVRWRVDQRNLSHEESTWGLRLTRWVGAGLRRARHPRRPTTSPATTDSAAAPLADSQTEERHGV